MCCWLRNSLLREKTKAETKTSLDEKLAGETRSGFRDMLWMTSNDFEMLLDRVGLLINRALLKQTHYKTNIPGQSCEALAITQ